VLVARLTYRGPSALATALVSLLTSEGLAASWDPEQEQHTGVYTDEVVIEISVAGGSRAVVVERATRSAVEKFTERFPGISVAIAHLEIRTETS
jgi:hypothetical protein